VSTPNSPGEAWRSGGGQPTATMPPVRDMTSTATSSRPVSRPRARRARLVLARVDPWSVMKLSFLLAIALAVIAVVAVFVIWTVLDTMGVFDSVGSTVESITRSSDNSQGVDILDYVGLSRVLSLTVVLAGVNVATLGAFMYNMAASLVGGLNVTFTEDV
jgi:hypothetical protein